MREHERIFMRLLSQFCLRHDGVGEAACQRARVPYP
jgi:hypothetical protein